MWYDYSIVVYGGLVVLVLVAVGLVALVALVALSFLVVFAFLVGPVGLAVVVIFHSVVDRCSSPFLG